MPESIARTSSTQFLAQSSHGSRPSSRHALGVPPYHQTTLDSHQSTRESETATARPSRGLSMKCVPPPQRIVPATARRSLRAESMLTVSLDTVSGIPHAAYTGSPPTGLGE